MVNLEVLSLFHKIIACWPEESCSIFIYQGCSVL